MAVQRVSAGSQPMDRRMKPGGTLSPQRRRRSPEVWVEPKLVDCTMRGQARQEAFGGFGVVQFKADEEAEAGHLFSGDFV